MINEPIVIMGLPRSGTSMVAGIFAAHGVFTGNCKPADERNPKGFYEHLGFAELMLESYGKGVITRGESVAPMEGFKDNIMNMFKDEGYETGPWLIKHATVWHKVWAEFKPHFVLVRRDSESILKSVQACGWKAGAATIERGQDLLNMYSDYYSEIKSSDLVNGDYTSLKFALKDCGLDMNKTIVDDFIDRSLWTH